MNDKILIDIIRYVRLMFTKVELSRREQIQKMEQDIQKYIQDYYIKHQRIIHPNHDINNNKLLKCPMCRRGINLNKKIQRVYVQTECICCLQPVSKTVLLTCSHANICIKCFRRIREEHIKIYHPYFIHEDGTPVSFCRKQEELYERKKQLLLMW